ncbi:MAG TPA: mechanosensitive ion channel family protein [Gammaproteobacteria bacterium]
MTVSCVYKLRRHLAALLLLLAVSPAASQNVPQSLPPATEAAAVDTAFVVVNGEGLFRVRGITAFPAHTRAAGIASRIEDLAKDAAFDPAKLVVAAKDNHMLILAGESLVMTILDEDAVLEGVQKRVLAEVYRNKIIAVIGAYRHDHQPKVILVNALYAVAGSAVLAGLIYAVIFLFRRMLSVLERLFKRRIESLEAKSQYIVQARQIWSLLTNSVRLIKVSLILVLCYIYLSTVLGLFPWTRWFAANLLSQVVNPLQDIGNAFVDYLPKLFFLIILILITRYLLKLTRMFFNAIAGQRMVFSGFEHEWAWPTYRIVRLIAIALAVVIAYPYIPGSDSAAFQGVSLFLGVLFSLGSTSVISNIVAGYTMTYRRAFRLGDWIKVENAMGEVKEIRLLVTHLRTFKNEEVIIPNSKILNTEIINYSSMARAGGLILHTTVGIGYEVPWRQVEAMLLLAAERTPGLSADTKAYVLQKSLGDFAVNYELNVYCDKVSGMPQIYTQLHRHIQDVFNEYGVQIMTPAYESDAPAPKIVAKENWYAAPAKPPAAETKK